MRLASAVFLLLLSGLTAAEPLLLSELLERVYCTHPKLAEARAVIECKEGETLTSQAAFEPTIKGKSLGLPTGFYQYHRMATWIEQTLPVRGLKVSAGYRRSDGTLPPYYQEYVTKEGGETWAQIELPLLADSSIDKERAQMRKAYLATEAASHELSLTWLSTARDATLSYWSWVAAGQSLRLARSMIDIAEDRAQQIEAQIDSGAVPKIMRVDNEAILLSRRTSIVKAEAKFVEAQNKLSLYFRDPQDCEPVVLELDRVPEGVAPVLAAGRELDEWIEQAVCSSPEMAILDVAEEEALVELELAYNAGLPKLDLRTFVARDLASGKKSLGDTDVGVGLSLSIPLCRREARGRSISAQAKLDTICAKRRGLRDQISADLKQLSQTLALAQQRLEMAAGRLSAAQKLAEAEQQRLEEGASDLLTVNLREQAVISAADDAIDAAYEQHASLAQLLFARALTWE